MTGLLIAVEGIDGAGKTTTVATIKRWLCTRGLRHFATSRDGYPPIDACVAALLGDNVAYDPVAHLLLSVANSLLTLKTQIAPRIDDGVIVVMDRGYYTTAAYNLAMDVPREWLISTMECLRKPDHVLFCDIGADLASERKKSFEGLETGRAGTGILEFVAFQKKVSEAYELLIRREPGRFFRIATCGDRDDVDAGISDIMRSIVYE